MIGDGRKRAAQAHFIQFHKPLLKPLDFIGVDCGEQQVSAEVTYTQLPAMHLQLEFCMMFSSIWLVDPVVLRRASNKAALFGSAVSTDMVIIFSDYIITVSYGYTLTEQRFMNVWSGKRQRFTYVSTS